MNTIDLDALEAAISKMTPGTWAPDGEFYGTDAPGEFPKNSTNDNIGICALRNAAPGLIAEVRRLRAAVRQASSWFDEYSLAHRVKARSATDMATRFEGIGKAARNDERSIAMLSALKPEHDAFADWIAPFEEEAE